MKVLVAGASGYLGYWITRQLTERGAQVLALSRRGTTEYGRGLVGDVTATRLGLDAATVERELSGVDVVVSAFGSVDWGMSPTDQVGLHVTGTRNVLDLAAALRVRRVVHVSSVLALGRAEGVVGNRVLAVDQSFRNWYEYAKYRSEELARREGRVPVHVMRIGAMLGPAPERVVPLMGGPLQALPHLLQGLPLLLKHGGRYPVYAGDVAVAGAVVAALAEADDPPPVCTYYDPRLPTMAEILHELCLPWDRVPLLVDSARGHWLQRLVGGRVGLSAATLAYAEPLVDLDPTELDELPKPLPAERDRYIVETAELLRRSRKVLVPAGVVR